MKLKILCVIRILCQIMLLPIIVLSVLAATIALFVLYGPKEYIKAMWKEVIIDPFVDCYDRIKE